MKGIVFAEFIEMVEEVFSADMADKIIDEASLPSGGAYTSVGTYDHDEIFQLVKNLSDETGVPVAELVQTFGSHLAGRFTSLYPSFFEGIGDVFSFLETIESHVHVEVKKLYPDAELPTFSTERQEADRLEMVYRSHRPFADLAEGLIRGCAAHFGDQLKISRDDKTDGDFFVTRFDLALSS